MIHVDLEPESSYSVLDEREDMYTRPHQAIEAQDIFPFDVTSVESNCPGEDRNSFVIKGNVACWAVVDGHGGSTACDIVNKSIASDIVDRIISLATLDSPDEIVSIVDDCFQLCDKAVLDDALGKLQTIDDPKDSRTELMRIREAGRPGCCVVVVVIAGDLLFTANVGDCRAVCATKVLAESVTTTAAPSSSHFKPKQSSQQQVFTVRDCIFDYLKSTGQFEDASLGDSPPAEDVYLNAEDDDFIAYDDTYIVTAITKDHVCTSPNERKVVQAMSNDPNPLRPSVNDTTAKFLRVAGSLAITRAVGDGYLKLPALSFEPYLKHLPYITCRPTVRYRKLCKEDAYLIIASDGLFNFVTASDILKVLKEYVEQVEKDHGENDNSKIDGRKRLREDDVLENEAVSDGFNRRKSTTISLSNMLTEKCLSKAARRVGGISASALKVLPQGKQRRDIIDDITVVTVDISGYVRSMFFG